MRSRPATRTAMLATAALVALGTTAASATPVVGAFTVSGTKVALTTARGSAPKLAPGLYRSTLPTDTNTHYASVTRSPGETLTVSVTGEPEATDAARLKDDQHLKVVLVTTGGDECDSVDTYDSKGDPVAPLVSTAVLDGAENKRSSYLSDGCKKATKLRVEVSRQGSTIGAAMPVEVLVSTEPKVSGKPAQAAGKTQVKSLKAPSLATTTTVDGGHGFSDASTLTNGSVLTDLHLGTSVFYKVRVGWGQRLAASLEAPRNGSSFAPPYDAQTSIALWSPQRLSAGSTYGGDLSSSATINKDSGEPQDSGSFTATVRYANRSVDSPDYGDLSSDAYRSAGVAGWYYVQVLTEAPFDDGPTTSKTAIPARLNIEVVGTADQGPHYVNASGAAVSAPPPGQLSVGGDQGSLPWGRVAGGVVAALLAAIACLWALRARRRNI